jgi:hypothetical protein
MNSVDGNEFLEFFSKLAKNRLLFGEIEKIKNRSAKAYKTYILIVCYY